MFCFEFDENIFNALLKFKVMLSKNRIIDNDIFIQDSKFKIALLLPIKHITIYNTDIQA